MKMQSIFRTGALAAMVLALAGPALAQEQRMVFIDLDRVFNEYHKTKLADQQLKDQADEFNEERKGLVDEYEKLEDQFNAMRADAQNMALSEEVRQQKRDLAEEELIELRKKERNIKRFEENRRKQLEEQQRRMRKRIVKELRETIQTYARENNVAAVFDLSGQSLNGVEAVVFADVKYDISNEILDLLNKGQATPGAGEAGAAEEADEEPQAEEPADEE